MKVIAHRRNSIAALDATPTRLGVEVDVRSHGSRLITQHDPFVDGDDFFVWLDHFRHGTLIVNVKEEALEASILPALAECGIDDFFFLDQSIPFLVRTAMAGEPRCAVRVSEYESIETALALAGRVRWVWVDCFTRFPLAEGDARRLREAGYRLCIVSPELQGRAAATEVPRLRALLDERGIDPDAVCTKEPSLWEA